MIKGSSLEKPRRDLLGFKTERLTVKKFAGYFGKVHKHAYWICECLCVKTAKVRQGSILNGQISCGCYLVEYRKNILPNLSRIRNSKPPGVAAFNELFNSYYQRSRRKKIEFSLNREQFKKLTSSNCHYCKRRSWRFNAN